MTGRLSPEILKSIAPDLLVDRSVYICGPDAFRATARTLLDGIGFPMDRYHEESFGILNSRSTIQTIAPITQSFGVSAILHSFSPETILMPRETSNTESARTPPPPESRVRSDVNMVFFSHSQKEIASDEDETILELAEQQGVQICSGCREGRCGICKQQLVDGAVRYNIDPAALSEDDRASGFILPCIAYPEGRVVLNL